MISGTQFPTDSITVVRLIMILKLIQLNFHFSSFFFFLQKRRERGRIDVRGIKLVEPAILHGDGGDSAAPNVSRD